MDKHKRDDGLAYASFGHLAQGREAMPSTRPVVCVQGLGFVGSAMAAAVAAAREGDAPTFDVIGLDLPGPEGEAKVAALNAGNVPVPTSDAKLVSAVRRAHREGNLVATTDERALALASVAIVNVPLDVIVDDGRPSARFEPFRNAVRTLGRYLPPGSLVIVETTVPPGTCEKIVAPELAAAARARGLAEDAILLAHSPERVMPGDGYFDSIVNFWRVYAGHTPEAADACERFLSSVVDDRRYPLRRLHSTTASETAKVLENSYRATTIALMEEWGRFAEAVGVDLFEVIDAIRQRPTHSNMRQPGFGVGGYCLTKDPLFGEIAARELFSLGELKFPFSSQAVAVNREMPLVSLRYLDSLLPGLRGRTILMMGVTYRPAVGDTRDSASALFVQAARARGATVLCQDPLVTYWDEMETSVLNEIPSLTGIDAVVFAVSHATYRDLDLREWLNGDRPVVLDANDVLAEDQRAVLRRMGCKVAAIGRGTR
jgi:UDP-N-acetyl-D-glucosamine dehydrogenase